MLIRLSHVTLGCIFVSRWQCVLLEKSIYHEKTRICKRELLLPTKLYEHCAEMIMECVVCMWRRAPWRRPEQIRHAQSRFRALLREIWKLEILKFLFEMCSIYRGFPLSHGSGRYFCTLLSVRMREAISNSVGVSKASRIDRCLPVTGPGSDEDHFPPAEHGSKISEPAKVGMWSEKKFRTTAWRPCLVLTF